MTFDPRVPARDKTPFGRFQMKPSHLLTGGDPVDVSDNGAFLSQHTRYDPRSHEAQVIAGQAAEAGASVEDLKEALEMVGFDVPNPTPPAQRKHRRPHEAT